MCMQTRLNTGWVAALTLFSCLSKVDRQAVYRRLLQNRSDFVFYSQWTQRKENPVKETLKRSQTALYLKSSAFSVKLFRVSIADNPTVYVVALKPREEIINKNAQLDF